MTHFKTFPFTAIVGQDAMKLALILNAINPTIGGVLVRGKKGTAKSTAVRALADLLPEYLAVRDCPFNCNPVDPKEACHACQHRMDAGGLSPGDTVARKMRVINLPINATEDRVVGTIDIKKALADGTKSLEPGILAEANRNILYIDEVNLLADNVADVLLDSAAMGINIVEREGISVHHPARFILIGTMNPEEGNIRPQLLDRFGLCVDVEAITDVNARVQIVRNAEAYHADPAGFAGSHEGAQRELATRIVQARELLGEVVVPEQLLKKIAEICVDFGVDGHRADITINVTAKTIAAFNGRIEVSIDDVRLAARLALNHRLRRLPFEDGRLDEARIDRVLDGDDGDAGNGDPQNTGDQVPPNGRVPVVNRREATFGIDTRVDASKIVDPGLSRESLPSSGRVVPHPASDSRGKYVRSGRTRPANMPVMSDVAVAPTVNAAAMEPENRDDARQGQPVAISEDHLRFKARVGKSSFSIIFCVDASGSMGAQERMEAVKGAVFSILQGSYVRRDKVALVVFRQDRAEVILSPTRSVDMAYTMIRDIPTGGTTPLVAGLLKALDVAREETVRETGYLPLVVLLSDAIGNVYFKDPVDEVLEIAGIYAIERVPMIVIDAGTGDAGIGLSKDLAARAGAPYHHVDRLTTGAIRGILEAGGVLEPGEA